MEFVRLIRTAHVHTAAHIIAQHHAELNPIIPAHGHRHPEGVGFEALPEGEALCQGWGRMLFLKAKPPAGVWCRRWRRGREPCGFGYPGTVLKVGKKAHRA